MSRIINDMLDGGEEVLAEVHFSESKPDLCWCMKAWQPFEH